MSTKARRRRNSGRSGFTLLEVILAASITIFLMAAVFQAMQMHFVQEAAGHRIAERAQLIRGIVGRMRADLGATYTAWKPPGGAGSAAGSGSGGATGGGTSTGTGSQTGANSSSASSSATGAQVQSEYQPPAGGVLGDAESFSIAARLPPRPDDHSEAADQQSPRSDLRVVRYRIELNGSKQAGGLIREETQRIEDPRVNVEPTVVADLMAPEVKGLQIRYFDGSAWQTAWDSTRTEPPTALEITLSLEIPGEYATGSAPGDSKAGNAGSAIQFVVALPPAPAEEGGAAPTATSPSTTTQR